MKKIFYALLILALYFWFVGSEHEKKAIAHVKELYAYCLKKWDKMDVDWHVHTPTCKERRW